MPSRFTFLAITAACLTPSAACANDIDLVLDAFHRTCLAHGPNFEVSVAAAERRGWKPLSEAGIALLAPVASVDAVNAWSVTERGMPENMMVAVTKATFNGRPVQTCSVALFDLDRAAFDNGFFARTDAEKIGEERRGGRVSRAYFLIAGGRKQLVNLSFPDSAATSDMIVASSIATKRGGLME